MAQTLGARQLARARRQKPRAAQPAPRHHASTAADAPVAALNRATGDIWVWWTVNIGHANYLRRVSFDHAGGFHADPPIVLTDKIPQPVISANIVAARLNSWKVANKDVVALAYSDTPDLLEPCCSGS